MHVTGIWRTCAKNCGVLVVLGVLVSTSACVTSLHPATAKATTTAIASTPQIEARLRALLNGRTYGSVSSVTWDAPQRRALVIDALEDHTRLSSLPKIDIFQIEKAVWTSQVRPLRVDVVVTANQLDAHGARHSVKVGEAHLTAARSAKFQWATLDWRRAWNEKLYDYQWVDTSIYRSYAPAIPNEQIAARMYQHA